MLDRESVGLRWCTGMQLSRNLRSLCERATEKQAAALLRQYTHHDMRAFPKTTLFVLVGVSDFFFLLGGGEGVVQGDREGGGSRFLVENPDTGGVSQDGRGGQGGWEGVCREFGGGGAKCFFRGRNVRQVVVSQSRLIASQVSHLLGTERTYSESGPSHLRVLD